MDNCVGVVMWIVEVVSVGQVSGQWPNNCG